MVRAQHGEPKKEASAEMQGLPSFVPCGFLADGPVFRRTHPAVNGLRRCRRLRREKAVPELEETGSGAPATRATRDHVSDRRGRWFEPNTGSQLRVFLNNLDGRQGASLSQSGKALNVYYVLYVKNENEKYSRSFL